MKLVWSAETASKAYIDTVKSCGSFRESSEAELVSAMAAGWNAKLIVETWSKNGDINTSKGLAIARAHTSGRHVCIVPDKTSKAEYIQSIGNIGTSTELHIGELEVAMKELIDIDFLVVDNTTRNDFANLSRAVNLGNRGAVLVLKNVTGSDFRWRSVVDCGSRRLARTVFLPVGKGLGIAHVAACGESSDSGKIKRRWYKSIDRETGEEYVIRK